LEKEMKKIVIILCSLVVALNVQQMYARALGILNLEHENLKVEFILGSKKQAWTTVPAAPKSGAGSMLAGLGYQAGSVYEPSVTDRAFGLRFIYSSGKTFDVALKADNEPILIDVDYYGAEREKNKKRRQLLLQALAEKHQQKSG
jgi:hypothetical protein